MKKRRFATMVGAMVLTLATTVTAFAGTWKQDNVGWWYQRDDGSYPMNGWEWIDGNNDGIAECYYFNEVGYILADTMAPDGYQVNADGAWVENGVVQTMQTTPTAVVSVQQNAEQKIGNSGHWLVDAGVFGEHSKETAPVYNGSTHYDSVVNKLNGYLFDVYQMRFFRSGLGQNDNQKLGTAKIVQDEDGNFGLTIIGWRNSYDSSATVNNQLNAVLEAMYYFTGDRDFAYRLWSVVDSIGINGASNTEGAMFGLTEICLNATSVKLSYNSYDVILDWSTGQNIFWFK